MKKCVFCEKSFDELSCEHIIPNILCGRLKSNELLCTKCNNDLGNTIDKFLNNKFSIIINIFGLMRERGTPPPASAELVSGRPCAILHGGQPMGMDVEISMSKDSDDNIYIHINAPKKNKKLLSSEISKYVAQNEDVLMQCGIDYKKAIPNIIKAVFERVNNNDVEHCYHNEPIHFRLELGGKDFYRALLKILFLFLLYNKKDINIHKENIKKMIETGDNICNIFYYCFAPEDLFEYERAGLYHSVSIKSFCEEKILLGFIDLFGITPYICLLDANYEGEDISLSYGYDLLQKKEVTPKLKFSGIASDLKDTYDFQKTSKERLAHHRKKLQHLMQIYELYSVPERIKQDLLAAVNNDSSVAAFLSSFTQEGQRIVISNLDTLLALKDAGSTMLHKSLLSLLLSVVKQ